MPAQPLRDSPGPRLGGESAGTAATLAAFAGIGARAGLLFAAFDALAASWLARALHGGLDFRPQSVLSFLLSGALHALLGAGICLLAAVPLRRASARLARDPAELAARCATLGVLLAILGHQWSLLPNGALEIRLSLILSLGLGAAILASLTTRSLSSLLAGLASPWTAAGLLCLVPWMVAGPLADSGWSTRQTSALACAALVAVTATLGRRWLATRRALSPLVVLGWTLACFAGAALDQGVIDDPRPGPAGARGPNVILIVLDTVRADHLSVYGYDRDTTPFLKEFAREAVVFERSTSAADFTLASHASLFTGRYPIDHGARPDPDRVISRPLSREAETLAEILALNRWWTCGVAANCVLLHPQFGVAQGFEHYDARTRRMLFPRTPPWTLRARLHDSLEPWMPRREFDVPFRNAAEINGTVLARLRERPSERPFFLFVNYMDAHMPLRPPRPFDSLFQPDTTPVDMPRFLQQKEVLYAGKGKLPESDREQYLSLYDGSIAYLDSQLEALFGQLRALGLYDDSLILVTADHGEAFGGHGTLEHGMSAYQEQVRVPLLIKRPHAREGSRSAAVASGVDVLPTVLAVLGLPLPEGLPGVPLLGATPALDRIVFSEHYPTSWHRELNPQRAVHQTAASVGGLVYLRRDHGETEIYDVDADPRQEHPLAALPPGAADLNEVLKLWVAPERKGAPGDDQRTLDALRSLGYAK